MIGSDTRDLWARVSAVAGGVAMIVGAIDPMEGSLAILPGSLLFALGTLLGRCEREVVRFRLWVAALIAVGVSVLWGSSMIGGFGGETGRSMWWALLILPYPLGWSLGIWGPGSPRWFVVAGGIVGLWYLVLGGISLMRAGQNNPTSPAAAIVIGAVGALTVAGCVFRLTRQASIRT